MEKTNASLGENFPKRYNSLSLVMIRLKEENHKLDLMVYSGWTYEQLLKKAEEEPAVGELLKLCDTLVDGPFIVAQKDLTLRYRGSKNQRYIDLVRTRISGKVTLVDEGGWSDRRSRYRL